MDIWIKENYDETNLIYTFVKDLINDKITIVSINKETEKAITKTSYPVQKVFDHINISQKSKPNNIKTYTSRSKVLVRLLCGDSNDFMCIYKKTNVKICTVYQKMMNMAKLETSRTCFSVTKTAIKNAGDS